MKLQNILKGITYAVTLAVAVMFYVQSRNVVAQYNALSTPTVQPQVPTPDAQQVAAARVQAEERAAAQKAANEQSARLKAELAKVAIPAPKPAPTPEPIRAAYSIVPSGTAELVPLAGWVDQPNKNRPGRVHTNLMVRHEKSAATPHVAPRAPCLKMVSKPAERIERPYGWIDVPARTIPVACGS